MGERAFILRITPGNHDRVPEALDSNEIIIGWAQAAGLLNLKLEWEQFRKIVSDAYFADEHTLRRAGSAAGHLWRFIREMEPGSLVVVPYWSEFYVAEVTGAASYDKAKVEDDTAYRRSVRWLNEKRAIPRQLARSALLSRMKAQGTSVDATDLLDEIKSCLDHAKAGTVPIFQADLQNRLVKEVLDEIQIGRIESFGFERLIQTVLIGLGAKEARIVPRIEDKGADILATFRVAGAFQQIVAVQAKHWQPHPPVGSDVVEQLIRGIEAESAHLGMVITSGTISEEATRASERYFDETGVRIELLDGEQFAKLIVEHGIRTG